MAGKAIQRCPGRLPIFCFPVGPRGQAWDPELDYLYMASSTPTNNLYGGERPGDNLYAESVICVAAKTGERIWHFQAVHHGIWDYDFASMPVLAEITVDNRPVKAIIQVSKQAFTYVLDRETGEPIWPIEEVEMPSSTVPGEQLSATQPILPNRKPLSTPDRMRSYWSILLRN